MSTLKVNEFGVMTRDGSSDSSLLFGATVSAGVATVGSSTLDVNVTSPATSTSAGVVTGTTFVGDGTSIINLPTTNLSEAAAYAMTGIMLSG